MEDFDREAYSKKYEADQIEYWTTWPAREPYTAEEFDNLEQAATMEFRDMQQVGKAGYVTLMDMCRSKWNDAARNVNPGEHWKVWNGSYPCYYSTWDHPQKYNNMAYYYINKALACGFADNATDAVKWFKDNK